MAEVPFPFYRSIRIRTLVNQPHIALSMNQTYLIQEVSPLYIVVKWKRILRVHKQIHIYTCNLLWYELSLLFRGRGGGQVHCEEKDARKHQVHRRAWKA